MEADRYKMALEAIASIAIPAMDEYRVDHIMKRIAQEALKDTDNGE